MAVISHMCVEVAEIIIKNSNKQLLRGNYMLDEQILAQVKNIKHESDYLYRGQSI